MGGVATGKEGIALKTWSVKWGFVLRFWRFESLRLELNSGVTLGVWVLFRPTFLLPNSCVFVLRDLLETD